jgi:hypothetical protein
MHSLFHLCGSVDVRNGFGLAVLAHHDFSRYGIRDESQTAGGLRRGNQYLARTEVGTRYAAAGALATVVSMQLTNLEQAGLARSVRNR